MKQFCIYTMAAALMLGSGAGLAQETKTKRDAVAERDEFRIFAPDQVKWSKGPESLPAGSEMAVLEGDPGKEGYFNMRLRLPDGYELPPHWHPKHERVTVLSGTVHLGHGEKFDREKTRRLPVGSHFSMEPETRHFAWTEGETILQLATIGPWEITYVNPEDDPRKKR